MRKIITSLLVSILAVALLATPALAWGGGDANADVQIEFFDDPVFGYVGQTMTVSGVVTVTAEAETGFLLSYAEAWSSASYTVLDPNGVTINSDSVGDYDSDWFFANADASIVFPFSTEVYLSSQGDWVVAVESEAFARYWSLWSSDSDYDYLLNLITIQAMSRGGGSLGAEYDGQFLVIIQSWNQRKAYDWVETWTNGKTLKDGVDQSGRVDTANTHDIYRIVIPEGTKITCGGSRISSLTYQMVSGQMQFSPSYVEFSGTCSLYKAVDEKWVKVTDFTRIVGGQPVTS